MKLVRIDTQRAYEVIRDKITTLELSPGEIIDQSGLEEELGMPTTPIREALKLLAHDQLVEITDKAINVSDIDLADLQQLSELRVMLEAFSANQAAQRATPDDIVILEALRQEQASIPPDESRRLIEVDHKFHQAIAAAAQNKYLAQTLENYFGLSQRLWFLALPEIEFLAGAVDKHLQIVDAIKARDSETAEAVMRNHVRDFYDRVSAVLNKLMKKP
jgi:DNA-binding GntR family transcriptional regulator